MRKVPCAGCGKPLAEFDEDDDLVGFFRDAGCLLTCGVDCAEIAIARRVAHDVSKPKERPS